MLFRRLTYTEHPPAFASSLNEQPRIAQCSKTLKSHREASGSLNPSGATPNAAHGYRADKTITKASVDPPSQPKPIRQNTGRTRRKEVYRQVRIGKKLPVQKSRERTER
jgi:hypothetical protein